ncbi:MAG: class I SAM-dependent methyltransferase [Patulibacter sp.]|nr:class I SAM-dependent methyltransferase [Patulibacter sp.]
MSAVASRTPDLDHVRWHDLECGGYTADLAFWTGLAREHAPAGGALRVLDVGCGTGRVALPLAAAGHRTVGSDVDPVFCAELDRRAADRGLPVAVAVANACALDLGERFGLIAVPMQTVQLLPGSAGRRAMLVGIRRHLAPDGVAAIAIVDQVEPFGPEDAIGLAPDMKDFDGTVYASRPVGVTLVDGRIALDRVREIVEPSGHREQTTDRTLLEILDMATLEAEAAAAGLRVLPRAEIAATTEHVGSQVVMLGA